MDEYIDMRLMNVINCAKAWRRAHRRDDKAKAKIHLMRLAAAVDVLDAAEKAARPLSPRERNRLGLQLVRGGK